MADNPPDDDERLAKAFAKGLEIYEAGKAERDAKAQVEKEKENPSDDSNPPRKSLAERLLGF